jgi:pimeloyl-ACP methyl ester carboxylesterase
MKLRMLTALHLFMKVFFNARGFKWEQRRTGELQLGYWKMALRPKDLKKPYPRRFVIIPGFGDSPLSWYPVVVLLKPWLKAHYDEVILFDFPGFSGFLARERFFPTMDELMQATGDALDALKPSGILGHSLGGWLTSAYAADCGRRLRPASHSLNYRGPDLIFLVCPSGVLSTDETVKARWEYLFKVALKKEGFSALRPHVFGKEPFWFRWVEEEFSKFVQKEEVRQFIDSVQEHHYVDEKLREIQCPVWFVWGEKDTLTPPLYAETWLAKLGGATEKRNINLVLLPGSGHSPHVEKPAIMAAILGRVIANKDPYPWGSRWWKHLPLHPEKPRLS